EEFGEWEQLLADLAKLINETTMHKTEKSAQEKQMMGKKEEQARMYWKWHSHE
ncbi:hypothetical protein HK096_010276, partial [Nowakowskiella sp. JEL0078]